MIESVIHVTTMPKKQLEEVTQEILEALEQVSDDHSDLDAHQMLLVLMNATGFLLAINGVMLNVESSLVTALNPLAESYVAGRKRFLEDEQQNSPKH